MQVYDKLVLVLELNYVMLLLWHTGNLFGETAAAEKFRFGFDIVTSFHDEMYVKMVYCTSECL